MGLHAYLECPVKGTTQKGNTPVIAFNHHASTDANQAFVIRKKIDAATPEFHRAMIDKVVMSKWELQLWHNPRSGPECNYVTISLEKATIAWISQVMPDLQMPEFANTHEYEDIAFTFESATYQKKAEG